MMIDDLDILKYRKIKKKHFYLLINNERSGNFRKWHKKYVYIFYADK